MSKKDFRQIYFYEFKLDRTAAQTARNINQVWGEGSVNEATVQRWFQRFRHGRPAREDRKRRTCIPDVNDQLKMLVQNCPRATVQDFAKLLELSPCTVAKHLQQIGVRKKGGEWTYCVDNAAALLGVKIAKQN
ncbi:unnamed protein product [Anisakis simplex]|uniref:HTH_48 domain-containing protein n=1 Tax=Anisakis simplex TaxID=6269 RepID=A0A0M3KAP3_ANISI|nr:unnamed protein product [Anisakis simplex]